MSIAPTPKPPYVAVIFTSQRTDHDAEGYAQTASDMAELAATQPGYLGIESVRDTEGFGITVSYWQDEDSIKQWKAQADHITAQKAGRQRWYKAYSTRICTVTRDYGHP